MLNTKLTGSQWIGSRSSRLGTQEFTVASRLDGAALDTAFAEATEAEVGAATQLAASAAHAFGKTSNADRAGFLRAISEEIYAIGDELLQRANAETALPLPRLTGERDRTCNQLKMFADLIEEGSYVDARIEMADPNRNPPKPDLRRMLIALGPVAVFGASNFPLAFSVAGGDTASALAAGCPVIFKAHPAHPGTSELVAAAILAAAKKTGMPDGVFSMVHGGVQVGKWLVESEPIEAVGFTGSLKAGRALFDLAAARLRPIPVYAEMGSVNPVFLLPGALAARGAAVGTAFSDSLTMGVGQFCTNPGLVIGVKSTGWEAFLQAASARLAEIPAGTMLTDGIHKNYSLGVEDRCEHESVSVLLKGDSSEKASGVLFKVSASEFLAQPALADELFGPSALLVECSSDEELMQVAEHLEGQLTATIHWDADDLDAAKALVPILEQKAGRILLNGFPTGVEVNSAMQHGGPYPATTDSRSTSVGTAAIFRFLRPVAYQNFPPELLPEALR